MTSVQAEKAMAELFFRLLATNARGGRASPFSVRRREACAPLDEHIERHTIGNWGKMSGGAPYLQDDVTARERITEYLEDLFIRRMAGPRARGICVLSDHQTSAVLGHDLTIHIAAVAADAETIDADALVRALEPGRSAHLFHPTANEDEPSGHQKLESRSVLRALSPVLGKEDDFWTDMEGVCDFEAGQHIVVRHDARGGLVIAITAATEDDRSDVVPIRFLPKTRIKILPVFPKPLLSGAGQKAFEAGMAGNRLAVRTTHLQKMALEHKDIWVFEKGPIKRLEEAGLVHVLPDNPIFRVSFGSSLSQKCIEAAVVQIESTRLRKAA